MPHQPSLFDSQTHAPFAAANRRRHFLTLLGGLAGSAVLGTRSADAALPQDLVFKGEAKFRELCRRAERDGWASLSLDKRTMAVASQLLGTPYGSFTLEVHNHIEACSVNFHQLDCWTFYEISLAFARMVRSKPAPWAPADLLRFVELERYRDGTCTGNYLSRMHHLEEVFHNNEKRGLGRNMTRSLGGVPISRNIREMQIAWKSYRYLVHNPSLRPAMAQIEARVSRLPVHYIPRDKVAGIEARLQNGDVLAIVARDQTAYTSHVGLALREGSACRFVHATSNRTKGRCCIKDKRISSYLNETNAHLGLAVFRPSEAPSLG